MIALAKSEEKKNNAKKKGDKNETNAEGDYEVASQWKLMWWKFRKHKLAMVAAPILIILYLAAIFADFIAPHLPAERFTSYKYCAPTKLHWVDPDGKFGLHVYALQSQMDPQTFRVTFVEDKSEKYPVRMFVRGQDYKLLGLFKTNVHLFGLEDPDNDRPFYIMGTDKMGRDLFTRVLYGSRISLSFGFVSLAISMTIGLLLGGLSGYLGGVIDTVIQRAIDLVVCIPTIPLWMSLAAALPRDWPPLRLYLGMCVVMSFIGWAGLARVTRGKILSLREEDFTMAARLNGASHFRIIVRHLIPSFMSYIIVSATASIPASILGETSLSFLGLGLQPPVVSWGVLLQDSQKLETLAYNVWQLWPAAFIIVTVLTYNFLGDGLRDRPKEQNLICFRRDPNYFYSIA